MFGLLRALTKEDGDQADSGIKMEYGRLLHLSCLYPDFNGRHPFLALGYYCFFLLIAGSNFCLMFATSLVSISDIAILSETLHFLLLLCIIITLLIVMTKQRRPFSRFHARLVRGFFEYEGLDEESAKINSETRKYRRVWLIFWPIYYLICVLCLICFSQFNNQYLEEGNAGPENSRVNRDLPLTSWTPYDSKEGFPFYATALLQILGALIFALVLSSGNVIYIFQTQYICAHLTILKMAISKLEDRAMLKLSASPNRLNFEYTDKSLLYSDKGFLSYYRECLKENIKHHQKILEIYYDFQELAGPSIAVPFIFGGLSLASAGVLIIVDGRVGPILTSILFCIGEASSIFVLCWFGEQVYQTSFDVKDAIYSTNWFRCPSKDNKSVLIMMERTKSPLLVLGGGIVPANLQTFANVMSAAYSYFNLLFAL